MINYLTPLLVCPGPESDLQCQELRLYLVWDSEGVSETTDEVIEDIFQAVDKDDDDDSCDGEAAKTKKSNKKKAKKQTSSSKSGSGSDDDASSESKVGF